VLAATEHGLFLAGRPVRCSEPTADWKFTTFRQYIEEEPIVKKRSTGRRHNSKSGLRKGLPFGLQHTRKQRKSWVFERLEDRCMFSGTPADPTAAGQWVAISSATPQGRSLIAQYEAAGIQEITLGASQATSMAASTGANDPDFGFQWNLFNAGQLVEVGQVQAIFGKPGEDIDVIPAWAQGYTGQGVLVAVVDTGVQMDHPDLQANINTLYAYDALSNDSNPSPPALNPNLGLPPDNAHGTAVAGIIGAAKNGIGGQGVAYGATIVPIRLIPTAPNDPAFTDQAQIRALSDNGAPIDIYNNSWGPGHDPADPRALTGPDLTVLQAIVNTATLGRNGKGAIQVYASGNDGAPTVPLYSPTGPWASAEYNGYLTTRYTIAVGGVDHDGSILNTDGTITLYPEAGPNVLVVAPTASGPLDTVSDFDTGSGIFTTDLTGTFQSGLGGYNYLPGASDGDAFATGPNPLDYTSRFGGTSAAAPEVSGVIALMLQANPNLTYRDVQEILVRSARQNDPNDVSWITNYLPLFFDPVNHLNTPSQAMPPVDDEIHYIIQPGTITTPEAEATTPAIQATNFKFTIAALKGGPHAGAAGNGISVSFVAAAGPPAGAQVVFDATAKTITITVKGTPAWSVIDAAVTAALTGDFDLVPAANQDASSLFNANDVTLIGTKTLAGGVDPVGTNPTAVPDPKDSGPSYDPILNPRTQVPQTQQYMFTNGAGYTVSDGRTTSYMTEYGYAHGVVDAGLAVALAKQWTAKNQTLATELTYVDSQVLVGSIPINPAENFTRPNTNITYQIPGGIRISNGFSDYFSEFFKKPTVTPGDKTAMPPTMDMIDPKSVAFGEDQPPQDDRNPGFLAAVVPQFDPATGASEVMSITNVDVQLDITGDANALDALRIVLVSPAGVQSELNPFQIPTAVGKNLQVLVGQLAEDPPGTLLGGQNNHLVWTFTTNRDWGERSDEGNGIWKVYFENYSTTGLSLNGIRVSFHGTPVGNPDAIVERVQGIVGVDSGAFGFGTNDGDFNYNRYVADMKGNRTADFFQEQFGSNVTVYAIDKLTNQKVAQFITGADGNYYFDLPAGDYTFGIEDPLGRTAETGTTSVDNGAYDFKSTWDVTVKDKFISNVNFLLNTPVIPSIANFSGTVFADLNGDGTQQSTEGGAAGFTVFADLNHTGKIEPGEPSTITDANGHYNLSLFAATPNTYTIGVVPSTGWTATTATQAGAYVVPGGTATGIDFGFKPTGNTGGATGILYGFVFNDLNGDGNQQPASEGGLANITVYIDVDNSGTLNAGDISTVTDTGGGYHFDTAPPGTVHLRVNVSEPLAVTAPLSGVFNVNVAAGQIVGSGLAFGIHNFATDDYGDLQAPGFLTFGPNAPHNPVYNGAVAGTGFSLGTYVDAEVRSAAFDAAGNPIANENGKGDDDTDATGNHINDEDGVSIVGGAIRPGVNTLLVKVQGVGGYLNGWIDLNNNGTFDAGEQVFTNVLLNSGTYPLTITAPQSIGDGTIAARFRWGDQGQNWFGANPNPGEVEDYLFASKAATLTPGDYNGDQAVNSLDYNLWLSTFGSTTDLRADGNHNNVIDAGDYTIWADHKTSSSGAGSGALSANVSADSAAVYFQSTPAISASDSLAQSIAVQQYREALKSAINPQFLDWLQRMGGHAVTYQGPNGLETGYVIDGTTTAPAAPETGSSAGSIVTASLPVAGSGASSDVVESVQVTALPYFAIDASPQVHSAVLTQSSVAGSTSDASLLLIDQALANYGGPSDSQHDDDLATIISEDHPGGQEQLSDLALAAAFDSDSDWRNGV
jgi:subtilisin family serine protease